MESCNGGPKITRSYQSVPTCTFMYSYLSSRSSVLTDHNAICKPCYRADVHEQQYNHGMNPTLLRRRTAREGLRVQSNIRHACIAGQERVSLSNE